MKRIVAALLALVMVTSCQSPLAAQGRGPRGEQEAAKNGWLFSLEEGKTQARQTGRPLMVALRCVP